ncbi:MAG: POTRA domain-containing protein, partial [Candidatus Omnitrophica bacterium]|nr:POTRA domain-containing protein [Candidatus Omnitrophota bacterium]
MNKIILFFLSAILIFNVSILGHAAESTQDSNTAVSEAVPNAAPEISLAKANPDEKSAKTKEPAEVETQRQIKKIEIIGNKVITSSTILSKIKTRTNQPYYSRVARDDIKRLYETGFFSDVSIDYKEEKDGVKVII